MTKKKVVFISFTDFANPLLSGLLAKMNGQAHAFRELGYETECLYLSGKKVVNDRGDFVKSLSGFSLRNSFFSAVVTRLKSSDKEPEMLYIRYPFSTPGFIRFLKAVRTHFPEIKIILEVPTFPYDREFVLFQKWKLWIDSYYRKNLVKYTDLVVTFGNEQSFEGIQTINLTNGTEIPDLTTDNVEKEEIFTFVAVGNWRFWHGLDRFLYGMSQYLSQLPEVDIQLMVIGDGEDLAKYKKLAAELKLTRHIRFLGEKTDEDTKKILQTAHVGVGVLGSFRKGLVSHSPLKHRFYAVCGLPFVFSTDDPDFSGKAGFICQFPPNEEPVSIQKILDFYKKGSHESVEIINYAQQQLSWKNRMEKVVMFLVSN
jgi:glycosyltransferase involved in cell wall biosynthesis